MKILVDKMPSIERECSFSILHRDRFCDVDSSYPAVCLLKQTKSVNFEDISFGRYQRCNCTLRDTGTCDMLMETVLMREGFPGKEGQ